MCAKAAPSQSCWACSVCVVCGLVKLQAADLGGVAVGRPARGGQAVQRGQGGVGGGRQDMGGGS